MEKFIVEPSAENNIQHTTISLYLCIKKAHLKYYISDHMKSVLEKHLEKSVGTDTTKL